MNSRLAIATVTSNFQTGGAGMWYSVTVLGMSLKLSKFAQKLLLLVHLIFPLLVIAHFCKSIYNVLRFTGL